jgi:spore germination protein YaaH/uncharacterized Zn-binding protein involved in type VI secretion
MSSQRRTLPLRLLVAIVVLIGMMPPVAAQASSHSANRGYIASVKALQPRPATTTGGGVPTKEVFGFATAGSLADPTFGYPTWNFSLLSTVAFFAIHAQYNGVLIADSNWTVWDSSTLTGLVSIAHAHGVKVVVTLVGPHNPIDQCDSLYNADTTVLQIVNQVVLKGVDGVNIDYEGQLGLCQNNNPALNQTNQALLTNFAKLMRAGLDKAKPGYYLSIDTYSGSASGPDGYFNIPDLNLYVDSFFVMAYDMDYANEGLPPLNCTGPLGINCLSPVSPLTNYYYNDTTSMTQYSAVAGAGKTILGQPYYGRVACVASPVAHARPTGSVAAATYLDSIAVYSSPDVQPGTYATHRDADDPTGLDRWDTWYDRRLGCWREMYWADVTQLGARYDFVNQAHLRGVGFWTLNYGGGAPELWSALQSHFVTCTNVQASPNPSSPQPYGTPVQFTLSSGNCPNPQYEVWIQPPQSSSWQLAQAYSSSTTFNWDTASHPTGSYHFSVWARDARSGGIAGNSLGSWDSYIAVSYTLGAATPAPCTSVTTSVAPPQPEVAGTLVNVAGAAAGCPNPRYQFWMLAPLSSTWQLVQAYSTNATFGWSTTAGSAGAYIFSVWARDASSFGTHGNSLGTWDAYSAPGITVITKPCASVSVSSSPPSTAISGAPVTITGSASGCPNPLYQFWMLAPGSSAWQLAQGYSTNATLNWNTSGKASGVYVFSVWVRDSSSIGIAGNVLGRWDAYAASQYTLTSTPCTAVSVASSPSGTTTAGTPVSITGNTSTCPNPLYQFFVLAPGSSTWQLAQGYSTNATLNWNTTGQLKGIYHFSVWVRDASSIGTAGNSLGRWDAYNASAYTLT